MHEEQSFRFARLYHLIGFVVLCGLSVPLHFTYNWLGNKQFIGYVTPVNESIWEHLKLSFWPIVLWWGLGYLIFKGRQHLNGASWLFSTLIVLVTTPLIIVCYYYVFTAGFNIVSPTLNILSIFIGFFVGQCLALHSYRYMKKPKPISLAILFIIVLAYLVMSIVFTYSPPDLPIFIPPTMG